MQNSLKNKQEGFTLIELSIVIVIIGILVGGVVLGGKVIDRARLAKFATELSDINRAVVLFQDTYNAWPGDYAGTGTYASDHAKCTGSPFLCSGDGDGEIKANNEPKYANKHLIYYGFLNSSFDNNINSVDGIESFYMIFPKSYGKKILSHFHIHPGHGAAIAAANGGGNYNSNIKNPANVLFITDTLTRSTNMGILTAALALQIDKKIDDGYPLTGILGNYGDNTTNTASCPV